MKKRILSMVLTLAMVFTLLPNIGVMTAQATGIASATITDVTVTGAVGQATSSATATLTITGDTINWADGHGTVIDSWITNLPVGMKADIVLNGDKSGGTITFSGTPMVSSNAVIGITIPYADLTSNTSLAVTANSNAKFNISKEVSNWSNLLTAVNTDNAKNILLSSGGDFSTGAGDLTLTADTTINLNGQTLTYDYSKQISGNFNLNFTGTGAIAVDDSATLTIASGNTVTFANSAQLNSGSNNGALVNNGTIVVNDSGNLYAALLGTTTGTVKLGSAIASTSGVSTNGSNVILDLNGQTLTGTGATNIITVLSGNLTIKDSGSNGKITNSGTSNTISMGSTGTLTIENGTIENTGTGDAINAIYGSVALKGGTVGKVNAKVLSVQGNPTINAVLLNSLTSKKVTISSALTGSAGNIKLDGTGLAATTDGTVVATATTASQADATKFSFVNPTKTLSVSGANVVIGTVQTYTVTYNGNGNTSGTVPTDSSSPYTSGATITVLGNTGTLAKTDYIFDCWNTKADGTGTDYKVDGTGTFNITANTILYAKWAVAPSITTTSLSNGTVSSSYSQTLIATGTTPITWSIDSGSLPAGLSLNASTGVISGTPTAAGTSNFTVKATNRVANGTKTLSVTVSSGGGGNPGGNTGGGGTVTPPTTGVIGGISTSDTPKTANTKVDIIISAASTDKTNTVTVPVTVNGTTATVALTQTVVTDAIKTAQDLAKNDATATTVTLNLAVPAEFTTVNTTLSKADMKSLANSVDNLVLKTPFTVVSLDDKAITTVANIANDTIKIETTIVDKTTLPTATQAIVGNKPVFDFTITNGNNTISDFGNGKATVTIPYTLVGGEKANSIVIYYIKDKGELEIVRNCHYDTTTKTISFVTKHFSKYTLQNKAVSFSDVQTSAWYSNAVGYVAARELFAGFDGKFDPNGEMTRAMFATVLSRLEGSDLNKYTVSPFTDVNLDSWYGKSVTWAAQNGILTGYGNGTFGPNNSITREEMATMMYNYLKFKGEGFTGTWAFKLPYGDTDKIANWAYEGVSYMTMKEIMKGNYNNFNPKATASRAEVAQIFYNYTSKNNAH